jgi:hypothetical protein
MVGICVAHGRSESGEVLVVSLATPPPSLLDVHAVGCARCMPVALAWGCGASRGSAFGCTRLAPAPVGGLPPKRGRWAGFLEVSWRSRVLEQFGGENWSSSSNTRSALIPQCLDRSIGVQFDKPTTTWTIMLQGLFRVSKGGKLLS